jgi:hypothetical protein
VNLRDFGQPWIPAGERSGLLMRIAATGERFVVRADEILPALSGTGVSYRSRRALGSDQRADKI